MVMMDVTAAVGAGWQAKNNPEIRAMAFDPTAAHLTIMSGKAPVWPTSGKGGQRRPVKDAVKIPYSVVICRNLSKVFSGINDLLQISRVTPPRSPIT